MKILGKQSVVVTCFRVCARDPWKYQEIRRANPLILPIRGPCESADSAVPCADQIVTGPKPNAVILPDISEKHGWAPRQAQEARLRQLEDLLASRPEGDAIASEIERAVLLGALNRRTESQQAFVDILRRSPENFSALNEFGTLLTNMGAIDAACRVYSEAILHHPANPLARVNLANLLLRANRHAEARAHYEAALLADPELAAAHQGLGAVLADLGDRAGASYHFSKG